MANEPIYRYPPLIAGTLVRRYKRFLAEVALESGETVVAHCPNTGPMTGISTPGQPVRLSYSTNPRRKLAYTWELIWVADAQPTWVGVNTSLPNRIVKLALQQGCLPELAPYSDRIRSEVAYGRQSRADFVLGGDGDAPLYLEVKSTTWTQQDVALFPDTVTQRGQKHLRELMAVGSGAQAAILYFINRGDCPEFAPGDRADPAYGELLRAAHERGVWVLPYRFDIAPEGIRYLGRASFQPSQPPLPQKR